MLFNILDLMDGVDKKWRTRRRTLKISYTRLLFMDILTRYIISAPETGVAILIREFRSIISPKMLNAPVYWLIFCAKSCKSPQKCSSLSARCYSGSLELELFSSHRRDCSLQKSMRHVGYLVLCFITTNTTGISMMIQELLR